MESEAVSESDEVDGYLSNHDTELMSLNNYPKVKKVFMKFNAA